ncbi:hypothetical protein [Marimonas lutisalis]|uniref:hypothetical protein n=1 Tax=Marimonas lutisalis TaxID=2545756 RepID=UPI0010F5C22A|nr:hypothetical protein [Marimonas lutisalis]
MQCIGDECVSRSAARTAHAPTRRTGLRNVALGIICAAAGYVSARPVPDVAGAGHLPILAPPIVMVSHLGN